MTFEARIAIVFEASAKEGLTTTEAQQKQVTVREQLAVLMKRFNGWKATMAPLHSDMLLIKQQVETTKAFDEFCPRR